MMTEWMTADLRNNGGMKERFQPTLAGSTHLSLSDYTRIRYRLRYPPSGRVIEGEANKNTAGNFKLQGARIEEDWPSLPNAKDYQIAFEPVSVDEAVSKIDPSTTTLKLHYVYLLSFSDHRLRYGETEVPLERQQQHETNTGKKVICRRLWRFNDKNEARAVEMIFKRLTLGFRDQGSFLKGISTEVAEDFMIKAVDEFHRVIE